MKTFDLKNGKYIVQFKVPGPEFQELLAFIKGIQYRVFAAESKVWLIPATKDNYNLLVSKDFTPTAEAKGLFSVEEEIVIPPTPSKEIDTSLLPSSLRPYQIEGVKFLEAVNGRGILGVAMRLGKSIMALSWCFLHPDKRPVLIVGPSSSKIGWQREVAKWSKDESIVLYTKTPYIIPKNVKYVIINYDILDAWQDYLSKQKFQVLIIDEVQFIANKNSKKVNKDTGRTSTVPVKRTTALLKLAKNIEHIISLSGTPFTSYPDKFWNALSLTSPTLFHNRWEYLQKYCNPVKTPWGMRYIGVSNVEKLRSLVMQIMFRKRKEDVFTELPKSERIIVPLEIDKDLYEKESKEYEAWFKANAGASDDEIARRMNLIKSISYDAKRSQIHEWIREFLDTGEKLVVFAYHRDVVEDIFKRFQEAVMVYGGMDAKERQKNIDLFQNSSIFNLFVGQVTSTNTAISLSAADTAAFVELPYTVGDTLQAEERIYMPGEKDNKTLTYYYLLAGDTVDEDRYKALIAKSKVFHAVMDGTKEKMQFEGKL